jgi:hypothetical protein
VLLPTVLAVFERLIAERAGLDGFVPLAPRVWRVSRDARRAPAQDGKITPRLPENGQTTPVRQKLNATAKTGRGAIGVTTFRALAGAPTLKRVRRAPGQHST